MNRFERLFFILEKNETASHAGISEPRGVIKIIITSDKMRVMAEINNLNITEECRYELAVFMKNTGSDGYPKPQFINIEANQHGNVRMDSEYSYSGGEICGVALASLRKNNPGIRQYPMVSFKIKQDEWRKVLTLNERVTREKEPVKKDELPEQNSLKKENPRHGQHERGLPKKEQSQRELSGKEQSQKDLSRKEPSKQELNKKEQPRNEKFGKEPHKQEPPEREYQAMSNMLNRGELRKLPSPGNDNEEPEAGEIKLNKEELLYKHFTECDPFNTTNKSYKWWRGSDMHQINRVLIEMNIRLPFELNKEGYLACELFGHILLGIYKDRVLDREFFILGIPAKSRDGVGNYYSNSRWEETGTGQSTDESGYWLTYIDCETSKVVKVI